MRAFAAALLRASYQFQGYKHCGNRGQGKCGHNSAPGGGPGVKRAFEIEAARKSPRLRTAPPATAEPRFRAGAASKSPEEGDLLPALSKTERGGSEVTSRSRFCRGMIFMKSRHRFSRSMPESQ
jgi:hypothetical protein